MFEFSLTSRASVYAIYSPIDHVVKGPRESQSLPSLLSIVCGILIIFVPLKTAAILSHKGFPWYWEITNLMTHAIWPFVWKNQGEVAASLPLLLRMHGSFL